MKKKLTDEVGIAWYGVVYGVIIAILALIELKRNRVGLL